MDSSLAQQYHSDLDQCKLLRHRQALIGGRALDWALKRRGLRAGQWIVLVHLARLYDANHGNLPTLVELANACGLKPSRLKPKLRALDEKGFIRAFLGGFGHE